MKCYSCGYEGVFGRITPSSTDGYSYLIGRMPVESKVSPEPIGFRHCGAVDIFVCPKCGALHSDMRGMIENEDRKK